MKPKNISQRSILVIVPMVLFLVLTFVIVLFVYQLPMGPRLETASLVTNGAMSSNKSDVLYAPAADAVCGETGVWNVLVLGSDAADLYYPEGSDLTRVVRVDFPNKQVSIYAFSRDLWVDTSNLGFTNPEINATKLGLVYRAAIPYWQKLYAADERRLTTKR